MRESEHGRNETTTTPKKTLEGMMEAAEVANPFFKETIFNIMGSIESSNVTVGPIKTVERLQEKMDELKQAGKNACAVFDLNRATIAVSEKQFLDVMLFFLQRLGAVVKFKNKFDCRLEDVKEPPCLLYHVELPCCELEPLLEAGRKWVVEVQVTTPQILQIKHTSHDFYKVIRTKKVPEVCPVCASPGKKSSAPDTPLSPSNCGRRFGWFIPALLFVFIACLVSCYTFEVETSFLCQIPFWSCPRTQSVTLTLGSSTGKVGDALVWDVLLTPLLPQYFTIHSEDRTIVIQNGGLYRFDVKIMGTLQNFPMLDVNGKTVMRFYGGMPSQDHYNDATLNFIYEVKDDAAVTVKFPPEAQNIYSKHHFFSIQKLEASKDGFLAVATLGSSRSQKGHNILWDRVLAPVSGLDKRYFEVREGGRTVALFVEGIYRFDVKILGQGLTYPFLTINGQALDETYFYSNGIWNEKRIANDATLNIVLKIAHGKDKLPTMLSVQLQPNTHGVHAPHDTVFHYFSIQRLGSADQTDPNRAIVLTLGSNKGKSGDYMLWDVVYFLDNEYFTQSVDSKSIRLHERGKYQFDVKILGDVGSNTYAYLTINEKPEVYFYSKSISAYEDATLNVVLVVEAGASIAVKLNPGVNIYAGRRHYLCIQKID